MSGLIVRARGLSASSAVPLRVANTSASARRAGTGAFEDFVERKTAVDGSVLGPR
jgi:hypothetical protein